MLGFDAIGAAAVADHTTDEPANIVLLPAAFLDLTAPALAVAAGAFIDVPETTLALTIFAPRVAGGASVPLPAVDDLNMQGQTPAILAGARPALPLAPLVLAPLAVDVRAGALIQLPVAVLALSAQAASVRAGAQIAVPETPAVAFMPFAPDIIAGNTLYFDTARANEDNAGAIGASGLGEYGVCEGRPVWRETGGSAKLNMRAYAPAIQCGVLIQLPLAVLDLIAPSEEIQARHRRVAVQAIAS